MLKCKYCSQQCIKMGFQKNGNQKWQCKSCKKYQQKEYSYNAYLSSTNSWIVKLLNEGTGVRSIVQILKVAIGTVLTRIKSIASTLKRKVVYEQSQTYEIDKL